MKRKQINQVSDNNNDNMKYDSIYNQSISQNIMKVILSVLLLSLCINVSISASPQFSWQNINGTSFIPQVHNQNIPTPCNSGWAFSAIDVFNSRMKIRRKAASPDLQISVQVLLSCDQYDMGCFGGQPSSAFRWISRNNITDSSCQSYQAKGYTNGYGCSSQIKCQHCQSGTCKSMANSKIYAINDYGNIATENDMMDEIQKYGPIACGINSTVLTNYTNGTIKANTNVNQNRINHYVLVYGWGVENGTKYWKAKNSWGSAWGNNGHFRIQKGKNAYGIQSKCHWGSPFDTWTNDIRNKTVPNNMLSKQTIQSSNLSLSYEIPAHLTASRSVLTPRDCSSAWAFAVVQMIADRVSKATSGKNITRLSVQALLNCGVGKCAKVGNPMDALIFIQKYGLPDQSCQNYIGADPAKQSCTGVANCGYCSGSVFQYKCYEYKSYKRWKIQNYGFFAGSQNMKNQLYNGPIVCGIYASQQFKKYKGGIFSQISVNPKIDHYVQIVGHGSEGGKNYWLGRNFWGTAWGESSMFRILMGSNNLGIQSKCFFAKGLI